jgi:hypothetical protein
MRARLLRDAKTPPLEYCLDPVHHCGECGSELHKDDRGRYCPKCRRYAHKW